MKFVTAVTSACLLLASISVATETEAAIRKSTNIPPQQLSSALQSLARIRDFQIVYRPEVVAALRSVGASGELTQEEALSSLLNGTGLTYRYLDAKTITIVPEVKSSEKLPTDAQETPTAPKSKSEDARTSAPSQIHGGAERLRLSQAESAGARTEGTSAPSASGALEEIVVTANKRTERLQDVPSSVSVTSGDALRRNDATSLVDYLALSPNVTFEAQTSPGFGRISMRGITSGGQQLGSTVGVVIDDAPIGSSTSFALGGLLAPDLDPNEVERIEVLRGPQGALYGANAIGGLFKYVLRDPDTHELSSGVKLETSSVQGGEIGYSGRANTNIPLVDGQVAMRLSGFYRQAPGFIDNSVTGKENVNSSVSQGLNASFIFTPSDRMSVRLRGLVQNQDADDGLNGIPVTSSTDPQPLLPKLTTIKETPAWSHVKQRLFSANINYAFDTMDFTSVTSRSQTSVVNQDDGTPVRIAFPIPQDSLVPIVVDADTSKLTQELRLSSKANEQFEWLAGVYYTTEDTQFTTNISGTTPEGVPQTNILLNFNPTTYTEYAAFGTVTYYFIPTLDLTLGMRYSDNEQGFERQRTGVVGNPSDPTGYQVYPHVNTSDSDLSYLANLRYRITPNAMAYARAASGYRPGGPRTLAPNTPPPPGFTDFFGPETLWNYEVGFKTSLFDQRLALDISVYDIEWKDIQGGIFIGVFAVTGNAADARSRGAEFQATLRPVDGLTVDASAGYNSAELRADAPFFNARSGDALPMSAKWTGSLNVNYERPLSGRFKGLLGANARYVSDRHSEFPGASGDELLPANTLVDVSAGLLWDRSEVHLFVKNVGNELGFTGSVTSTPIGPAFLAVSQPRTVGISFSQAF